MIEIRIRRIADPAAPQAEAYELLTGTFLPKTAAAALRALADEWDPKQPVYRGSEATRGGTT